MDRSSLRQAQGTEEFLVTTHLRSNAYSDAPASSFEKNASVSDGGNFNHLTEVVKVSNCCNDKACELAALRSKNQKRTLEIVLSINLVMFVIEFISGVLANSAALLGDSMDMLGDALVYGFSLYVVTQDLRSKAIAALFKGLIMLSFGLFVMGQAIYKLLLPDLPSFEVMSLVGLLALLANSVCFMLLWQHRQQDINMRSIWLCSRNDIIANIAVLIAAVGVSFTHSSWPDVLIGFALAGLFLHSAFSVLREATKTISGLPQN